MARTEEDRKNFAEYLIATKEEREARWQGHPVYALAKEVAGRLASGIDHGDTMYVTGNIRLVWEQAPCSVIDYLRNPTFGDTAMASPAQVWSHMFDALVAGPEWSILGATGIKRSVWAERLHVLGKDCPSA